MHYEDNSLHLHFGNYEVSPMPTDGPPWAEVVLF